MKQKHQEFQIERGVTRHFENPVDPFRTQRDPDLAEAGFVFNPGICRTAGSETVVNFSKPLPDNPIPDGWYAVSRSCCNQEGRSL